MNDSLPYELIDTPAALKRALAQLESQPSLAFDLEFDSNFRRYGVSLCLIQVSTPQQDSFLIDPLAGLDLAPLYTGVFENEGILKLVHSPGEDLRLLHSLGCFPRPLWDTEITARLLNYEQTSLSAMLESKLGVVLSGKQQRSNWFQRPLTDEQLRYAAADAAHLHALKAVLDAEAAAKGRTALVEAEQAALSGQRFEPAPRSSFLKPADERNLSPWSRYVLNAVLGARDAIARARNRPAFQIADDKPLRELVLDGIGTPGDVLRRSLAGPFRTDRHVAQLVDAYTDAVREAGSQNLSQARPPREKVPARVRIDRDRLFTPVQNVLAERYGLFTARFLLSNGAVGDVLEGRRTLSTLGSGLRRDIITGIAQELGLDVARYC